jgi:hypothetical protein
MIRKTRRLDIMTATRIGYLLPLGALLLAVPLSGAGSKVRIVQTNSAGDSVHLIDPAAASISATRRKRRWMSSTRRP